MEGAGTFLEGLAERREVFQPSKVASSRTGYFLAVLVLFFGVKENERKGVRQEGRGV